MNCQTRILVLFLAVTAACGVSAAADQNLLQQQNPQGGQSLQLKPENDGNGREIKVQQQNSHWTDLVTGKNAMNLVIATGALSNVLPILFSQKPTAMNYAKATLFTGVAILRRDSMWETATDLCSASSGKVNGFLDSFYQNPWDTSVKVAVVASALFIVGYYVKSACSSLFSNIWTCFSFGVSGGNGLSYFQIGNFNNKRKR